MEEWLIIIVRTLALFGLLMLAVPLLGRKPLSGMTMFDYIIGLVTATMIGLTALNVIPNFAHGLLGIFFWILAVVAVQFLVQKFKWAHDHLYGKEVLVIKEGKVLEENLQSARLTGEELLSQLRRRNVFQVSDVEFAVMEANGDMTTLLKREKQPLTPKDMRLSVIPAKAPKTVLLDGEIMDEPLTTIGLNRNWLFTELDKIGVLPENVFIGQVDAMGELYIDLFDDTIQVPKPSTKPLLLASLKEVESNFMTYALETQNKKWKKNYDQHAREMKALIARLEPYLNT